MNPAIVVSLDFELRWGLYDLLGDDMAKYRRNLEGVADVVPRLLELFERRGVRATWAVVGALACNDWDEFTDRAPPTPVYADISMRVGAAYRRLDPTGRVHFAPRLVDAIATAKGQDLASHTFAHAYFREPGFTRADAVADTNAVVRLFTERYETAPVSFVFPRNQVAYTDVLAERGVRAWRENPTPFYWRSTRANEQSSVARAMRLTDALMPLGRRAAPIRAQQASHFVRLGLPRSLWRLHCSRIRADAKQLRAGEALHLWWHPHNLGDAPEERVARVAELLDVVREAAPATTLFASMRDLAEAS